MIIKSLSLISFGKFKNQTFDLDKDLNLIYGLNEAGKTTLIHFIEGMIYGFYDPFRKGRYKLDIYDRYQPDDGAYLGHMVFKVKGKKYRVERNFASHTLAIYHPDTGEDLTDSFPFDSDLKQASLSKFLKLPYPLFMNTIQMVQTDLDTKKTAEHILFKRLSNLNKTKTTTFSGEGALKYLKDLKEGIGSKSAPTKPYAKALKKKDTLTEEKKRLDDYVKLLKNIQHEQILTDQNYEALKPVLEEKRREKEDYYLTQTALKIKALKTTFESEAKVSLEKMIEVLSSLNHEALKKDLNEVRINESKASKDLTRPSYLLDQKAYEEALNDLSKIEALRKTDELDKVHLEITGLEKEKETLNLNEAPIKPKLGLNVLLIIPFFIFIIQFIKYKKAFKTYEENQGYALKRVSKIDEALSILYLRQTSLIKAHEKNLNTIKTLEEGLIFTGDTAKTEYRVLLEENLRYQEAYLQKEIAKSTIETLLKPYTTYFEALKSDPSLEKLFEIALMKEKIEDTLGSFTFDEIKPFLNQMIENKELDEEALKALEEKERHYLKESSRLESERLRVLDVLKHYEKVIAERDEAKARIASFEETLKKIKKAEALLKRSVDIIEENFAPALSEAINARLKTVTLNRYTSIKIRKDLSFKVETKNGLKPLSYFSTGTLDQIYFAIRLGILDVLGLSHFPLLLDDAFMHYDDKRLEVMLKLLGSLDRQILLFTAHLRESDQLKRLKLPHERIDLNG